jgi:hypothetical protein
MPFGALRPAECFNGLARWLIAGLARAEPSNRILAGILIVYWAVWTAYAVIAKSSQGLHADTSEVALWAIDLQWGTIKHPPFLPALVRMWLSVFSMSDWPFYLLAVGLSTVGIYFSWLASGFLLRGPKRAAVPFLLMLIPFYNFHTLWLNHNVVLIPLWAITTYTFFRAYKSNNIWWSILTGVAAGVCVLAKYWSFFLLLGLVVAALSDKRRFKFLKSPAPWIMTAVSFGVALPHLLWLEANDFVTFTYARHRLVETWPELISALGNYTLGAIAYVAVPLILLAVLVRPTKAALWDTLFPPEGDRRFAAVIFWVPLLAAIPFALATSTGINGLWTMSGLSLFGVVLLSSPLVRLCGSSTAFIAMAAMVTGACALLASPVVAAWEHFYGVENHAAYTRQLAVEVSRIWRETTPRPMPYVSGDAMIANSVAFYMDGHPKPLALFPRTSPWTNTTDQMRKSGIAFICPVDDKGCILMRDGTEINLTIDKRVEVTIVPHWLGFAGQPESFAIDILVPHGGMPEL